MLHIDLIVLGKLKETFWQEAETEYLKRLKPWVNFTIHELKEEPFSEKNNGEIIKQKEAEKIITVLNKIKNAHIVVLDEQGKKITSLQFAQTVKELEQFHRLAFIIGGPLGLDDQILKLAKLKVSLSSLTFTHQMARVFLWEQIYRAMMINTGKKYHY